MWIEITLTFIKQKISPYFIEHFIYYIFSFFDISSNSLTFIAGNSFIEIKKKGFMRMESESLFFDVVSTDHFSIWMFTYDAIRIISKWIKLFMWNKFKFIISSIQKKKKSHFHVVKEGNELRMKFIWLI